MSGTDSKPLSAAELNKAARAGQRPDDELESGGIPRIPRVSGFRPWGGSWFASSAGNTVPFRLIYNPPAPESTGDSGPPPAPSKKRPCPDEAVPYGKCFEIVACQRASVDLLNGVCAVDERSDIAARDLQELRGCLRVTVDFLDSYLRRTA